jgi:hypothetical protein
MNGARGFVIGLGVALVVVALGFFLARGLHRGAVSTKPATPLPPSPPPTPATTPAPPPVASRGDLGPATTPRPHVILSAPWGAAAAPIRSRSPSAR